MGRPRYTSAAEQIVWMEKRIAELEAERDKYHDALNTAMTSFGELQAELEKKQQSTAMFKLGEKAGMERAAEIAINLFAGRDDFKKEYDAGFDIEDAIRKEITCTK